MVNIHMRSSPAHAECYLKAESYRLESWSKDTQVVSLGVELSPLGKVGKGKNGADILAQRNLPRQGVWR